MKHPSLHDHAEDSQKDHSLDNIDINTFLKRDAAAFLAAIVESSDDAIISKNLSGIITSWNKSAERLFGYSAHEAVGGSVTMLIPDDRLGEEPSILARIQSGERVDHFETRRRRKDGEIIDISLTISPIRDSEGTIIGASKIARDITERRQAEQRQEYLFREMHHRVKNLFSITGGLIKLAARTAETPDELARDMTERLMALARAYELTLPGLPGEPVAGEKPASLFQLLDSIMAPFDGSAQHRRWSYDGDDLELETKNLTDVALLLHEFATNAAKYGCLSSTGGHLAVRTHIDAGNLSITWKETSEGKLQPGAPRQSGFGSQLERAMSRSLRAEVKRDWQPDGLCIQLKVPLESMQRPA